VQFTSVIYHNNNLTSGLISRAEGWPLARLRILGPSFMVFDPAVNTVMSNYTGNLTIVNQSVVPLEIEFPTGFLFPDVVQVNFTLTMDPYGDRPIGSGELIVSVVAAPICQQTPFWGFPPTGTVFAGCGGYATKSVGSVAPGKIYRGFQFSYASFSEI